MRQVRNWIYAARGRPALALALSPVGAVVAGIALGADVAEALILLAIAAVPLWGLVGLQLRNTSRGHSPPYRSPVTRDRP